MIQPNIHDWYVGMVLQGVLSHPENIRVEAGPEFDDDAKQEAVIEEAVHFAFIVADHVMHVRKMRAEEN